MNLYNAQPIKYIAIKEGLLLIGEYSTNQQVTDNLNYLVKLSVSLGHPVTWYEFRDDEHIDAELLKAKFGFPVNVENLVKDAYWEHLKAHPQEKPVVSVKTSSDRKVQRMLRKTKYKGDFATLVAKLSEKRWAPMMELRDNGYRTYSLNCKDFLLEILGDIEEAIGGELPDMYLIEGLSGSPLNSPCYRYFRMKLGLHATWQDQIDDYRKRAKSTPHLTEQPRRWTYQPTMSTEELIKRLQSKSWVQEMQRRGAQGYPLTDEVCHEILSDVTEENGGHLPSWRLLADIGKVLHIPSETPLKARIGPRKVWKERLESYRQRFHAEQKFHPIVDE